MASRIVQLADSLVTHIEAGEPYSIDPIDVERSWRTYLERQDLGTRTKVTVVPQEITDLRFARDETNLGLAEESIDLSVIVRRSVDWQVVRYPDAVAELVEELLDQILSHEPGEINSNKIRLVALTFDPYYVEEHLSEYREFTSRITATYKTYR